MPLTGGVGKRRRCAPSGSTRPVNSGKRSSFMAERRATLTWGRARTRMNLNSEVMEGEGGGELPGAVQVDRLRAHEGFLPAVISGDLLLDQRAELVQQQRAPQ